MSFDIQQPVFAPAGEHLEERGQPLSRSWPYSSPTRPTACRPGAYACRLAGRWLQRYSVRILTKAVIDGASQLVLASVDRDPMRTFESRNAVALGPKFGGLRARAWEARNSKAKRSLFSKDPLAVILVLDLECVGTEPNRIGRQALQDVPGHGLPRSRTGRGVRRRCPL